MTGVLRVVWVGMLMLAIGCPAFSAVHPTVDFAFNPATFEYAWTVNYGPGVDVYFTAMNVFSALPGPVWTDVSGPWVGNPAADEEWLFTYPANGNGTYALRWSGQGIHTLVPGDVWTGTFRITIPNTQPVPGTLRTYASTLAYATQSTFVPSIIPEPSTLLALGSLLGLIPLATSRKRK